MIITFLTLCLLEVVLGIDNLIFISLVVQRLPKLFARRAQIIGLSLALVMRVIILFGMVFAMRLTVPLFRVADISVSLKDIVLIAGGVFLIGKSTNEMHAELTPSAVVYPRSFAKHFTAAVMQIVMIDIVFSLDSIITAVGLTQHTPTIVAAVALSMVVMFMAVNSISQFLKRHPTFKMLALSFILMIGTILVAEGLHFHVPRGYLYFSLTFSCFVELMNTRIRKRRSA